MAGHLAPLGVQMPQLALQQTYPPVQIFVPHGIAMSRLLVVVIGVAMVMMGVVERRRRRRRDSHVAVVGIRRRAVMIFSGVLSFCIVLYCASWAVSGIPGSLRWRVTFAYFRICECGWVVELRRLGGTRGFKVGDWTEGTNTRP
jgi:hypothetical protein